MKVPSWVVGFVKLVGVVFAIVGFLIAGGFVFSWAFDNLVKEQAKANADWEVAHGLNHTVLLNYTGTLGMVNTERRGLWGTGQVRVTHLTFTDGTEFAFDKDLQVTVGDNYLVMYKIDIFNDNRTEMSNLSIVRISGGD